MLYSTRPKRIWLHRNHSQRYCLDIHLFYRNQPSSKTGRNCNPSHPLQSKACNFLPAPFPAHRQNGHARFPVAVHITRLLLVCWPLAKHVSTVQIRFFLDKLFNSAASNVLKSMSQTQGQRPAKPGHFARFNGVTFQHLSAACVRATHRPGTRLDAGRYWVTLLRRPNPPTKSRWRQVADL